MVRVALVAEGWTDPIVVEAAVTALLAGRSFALKLLQPEDPLATGPFAEVRPGGWTGVYRWCREAVMRTGDLRDNVMRAGRLRDDVIFASYDILILHLDADVADSNYAAAHIHDAPDPTDLPCASPVCPPPNATTDPLRIVLLRWCGETATPDAVVLCTPSKDIEAWVLAALYPEDPMVTSGNLECIPKPGNILKAKPAMERLFTSGKKDRDRYQARQKDIENAWPQVRAICTEAERFSVEFIDEVRA